MKELEKTIKEMLTEALKDAFGEHKNSGRFIDTNRIPLICKDIADMRGDISEIKDSLKWVNRLVLGAVILAIIATILK